MMKGFSASVVFVIDSTISMGPYIERTKEAIDKIYQRIEKEQLQDKVKFGLVAYRSSVKVVPGLEYDSKMYVDPNTVKSGKDFLAKVHDLKQATVSSSKMDEDAYGGVMMALDQVDWTQFGARYVVLITDAGALEGSDSLSSTSLDAAQGASGSRLPRSGTLCHASESPKWKEKPCLGRSSISGSDAEPLSA
ncbi:vWA domain-containing protein [Pectobacterium brasiliense]|uniref:vWA domain-containing protein n=1 Tax=Pectobacterium brasiliense TaxID=180957 RepID=UPI001F0A9F5B|nr:vWA domain-containing protein [Pectobacterium brasiliense]